MTNRSQIFGRDARRYDRARPSYPAALVDDLTAGTAPRVLDVGCGTGIAARLFAARGCDVLGVEPDARMARVARDHGIAVDEATFEHWDPAGRTFDLVTCAQAWHWIDPEVGLAKAATALGGGGVLALFWNRPGYEPSVRSALDDVYSRAAPELVGRAAFLGSVGREATARDAAGIERSGLFMEVAIREYHWTRRYTADAYVDEAPTHSDHLALSPRRLAALLAGIRRVIADAGGAIEVHYTTVLIRADLGASGRVRCD